MIRAIYCFRCPLIYLVLILVHESLMICLWLVLTVWCFRLCGLQRRRALVYSRFWLLHLNCDIKLGCLVVILLCWFSHRISRVGFLITKSCVIFSSLMHGLLQRRAIIVTISIHSQDFNRTNVILTMI